MEKNKKNSKKTNHVWDARETILVMQLYRRNNSDTQKTIRDFLLLQGITPSKKKIDT